MLSSIIITNTNGFHTSTSIKAFNCGPNFQLNRIKTKDSALIFKAKCTNNNNNNNNNNKLSLLKYFEGFSRNVFLMRYWQPMVAIIFYIWHVAILSVYSISIKLPIVKTVSISFDTLLSIGIISSIIKYHDRMGFELPINIFQPKKVPWRPISNESSSQAGALILLILAIYVLSGEVAGLLKILITVVNFQFDMYLSDELQQSIILLSSHILWVIPSLFLMKSLPNFFVFNKDKNTNDNLHCESDEDYANDYPDKYADDEISASAIGVITDQVDMKNIIDNGGSRIFGLQDGNKFQNDGKIVRDYWKDSSQKGSDWYTFDWPIKSNNKKSLWVWWVCAGYALSVSVYRLADALSILLGDYMNPFINTLFSSSNSKGHDIFYKAFNSISSAYASGSNFLVPGVAPAPSFISKIIGMIAPCITAPLWEELFYRGLILRWLAEVLPTPIAAPLSAVIFAAHHARSDVILNLFFLGLTWTALYLHSGSLFVTSVVHCMWNSRAFLLPLIF